MLDCLKIDGYDYEGSTTKDYHYWINGKDLLQLAQYAIDGIDTSGFDPAGDGSYNRPWKLDGQVRTWLNMAKKIRSYVSDEKYFYICGRFVKKAGGYYMVDGGGDDGRYGYEPWDRKSPREGFDRGGPSYRNYANRLKSIQTKSSRGLTPEAWSKEKAEKLRRVLLADPLYEQRLKSKGNLTTGQLLPVIAATIFIAEPARNLRAFMVNKMLLDMMATGTTYGGRKTGSSPKQYRFDTVMFRDPHGKGGKLPAAMTGSAAAASPINPSETNLGVGAYTQAKELTLICHYFNFGRFQGTNESLVDKTTYQQISITTNPAIVKEPDESKPAQVAGYLKYLLQTSLHSFAS
jgi:hypothetical protein